MKLLTVNAEEPLPDIPSPDVGEQWVLVRFHREPLGILKFHERGCSATELSALIGDRFTTGILRHVVADSLESGASAVLHPLPAACPRLSRPDLPDITVAVCTRNGEARLPECLHALTALEYPRGLLQLLVVDNAPTNDATQRLIEQRFPSVQYVVEPRPGLDWARNRAVLEARGEVVAFTDDDVSVDRWWADALGRVFAAEPDVDAATGLVVPDETDHESQLLFERYGGFGRGYDRKYFRVDAATGERAAVRHGGSGRFGTGANMAFRRRVFDRIGLFDPALDVGTPTNGGGDLELFFRVLKQGGCLVYEPSAIVRHRHRRSYEQLREQLANNGVGLYAHFVRSARAYPDERSAFLRLGAWWMWSWNLRRLARSFVHHDFPRDLIVAELLGGFIGLRRFKPALEQAAVVMSSFGPQRPYDSSSKTV